MRNFQVLAAMRILQLERVTGFGDFTQAQVCSGGVDLREVDLATMESRKMPGLYFAGETAGRGRSLRRLQPSVGLEQRLAGGSKQPAATGERKEMYDTNQSD